jgi:serine phosphatase RsbU (regulator of sigma subunit)
MSSIVNASIKSTVLSRYLLFLLFLLNTGFGLAQKRQDYYLLKDLKYDALSLADKKLLDSAFTIYYRCQADTCRLNALSVLSEKLLNAKVWPLYNDLMFNTADSILKSRNSFPEAEYKLLKKYYGYGLTNKALLLVEKEEYSRALVLDYKAMKIFEEIDNKIARATLLNNIAEIYSAKNNYVKALEYHDKAAKLYQLTGNADGMATSMNNIANVYKRIGKSAQAMDYYLKALTIREKEKNEVAMAILYNNIGYVFYQQGEFETALNYYYKSLRLREKTGDKKGTATTLNNMSLSLQAKQDFGAATECLYKSVAIRRELGDERGVATGLANLADLYSTQKQFDKSMELYNEAYAIHEKIDNPKGIARILHGKASLYYKQGKLREAVEYSLKCLAIAKPAGFFDETRQSSLMLYTIYRKQKKSPEALAMYELYIAMRDSGRYEENKKEIIKQQMIYDFDKQRAADSIRVADAGRMRDEQYNHEVARQRVYSYAGIGGALLMLALAGASFIAYKNKKRSNQLESERRHIIEKQKNEVERKNREISDSIHYAKQIQMAMLPSIPYFSELFSKRAFLIYGPRDIVSGDFYWYTEHNGKLFVAAADCTGHGVPGCLMSMISINMLNDSVHKERLDDPSDMLSYVNRNIKRALQKESDPNALRDGMDIVLCCFDFNNSVLSFAAANRPLCLIRNGELTEYKATKAAIGGLTSFDQVFQRQELQLKKNDSLYIFTDGYADQFGGDKGKKMTTKRFKELLLSVQDKSIAEQGRAVADYFTFWAGKNEQVDDVLVIGIKV